MKGCIITIDAMGCQTDIAQVIIAKEADYILSLKGNQGPVHQQVQPSFEIEKPYESSTEIDLGHGRIEKRICSVMRYANLAPRLIVKDYINFFETKDDFLTLSLGSRYDFFSKQI